MKHALLSFFILFKLTILFAQPVLHFDELKKEVNPYNFALPGYLYNSIPVNQRDNRELIFKPLYEQFDYFDMNEVEWKPLYKFEYNYLPDANLYTLNEFSFDLLINDWINTRRTTYDYDGSGFQLDATEKVFDATSGGLVNNALYEQQHTATGSLLQEKTNYWNLLSNAWLANHKHDYSYYLNGKELSVTHSDWIDTSTSWYTYSEYISTYDSNENLTRYLGMVWNADSSDWLNETKDTLIYNLSNQVLHSESQLWIPETHEWLIYYGTDYEYDANGNLVTITGSTWDDNASAFKKLNQYIYQFDNNQLTNIIFQLWDIATSGWQNFNMISFNYDLPALPSKKIISNWNGTGWVATYQYVYLYDDHENLIESDGQTWNDNLQVWINVERYTANWLQVITSSLIIESTVPKLLMYPNPVSNYFYVTGLNSTSFYKANIADMKGNIVSYINIHQGQPVYIEQLSQGNYLLTIKENSRNVIAAIPFKVVK